MDMATIVHPDAGEATVPAISVPAWRSSGWELASAADQTADQTLVDDAPAQVSQLANAIGYALTERGVRVTAADAIAAAYHVVDQIPAVPTAEAPADGEEADDPPGSPAGESPATGEQPASAPGQQAKPSARPRRPSPKESE